MYFFLDHSLLEDSGTLRFDFHTHLIFSLPLYMLYFMIMIGPTYLLFPTINRFFDKSINFPIS